MLKNIESLLVSAGPGLDKCDLCGSSSNIDETARPDPINLPCIDAQCELCVKMWGLIKSQIVQLAMQALCAKKSLSRPGANKHATAGS